MSEILVVQACGGDKSVLGIIFSAPPMNFTIHGTKEKAFIAFRNPKSAARIAPHFFIDT